MFVVLLQMVYTYFCNLIANVLSVIVSLITRSLFILCHYNDKLILSSKWLALRELSR